MGVKFFVIMVLTIWQAVYVIKQALRKNELRQQQNKKIKNQLLGNIKTQNITTQHVPESSPQMITSFSQYNSRNRPFYFDNLQKLDAINYFDKLLQKYNYGSCGPRGFLGSYTTHLMLEQDLEDYYDQPAIVFSSYSTVIQSALQTFPVDVVITFQDSSFGICRLKESHRILELDYKKFIENNLTDQQKELLCSKDLLKFLVFDAEDNDDQIRDLSKILAVTDQYQIRTLMNEKFLQHGSKLGGTCQQFRETTNICVRNKDIDLITCSFEHSFGIPGGCCSGSMLYIGNMRTNALGYCYSASQPPVLCGMMRYLMRDVLEGFEEVKADVKEI